MPDYAQGKIYKIISDETKYIYIGSTTMTLNERLRLHKKEYKHKISGKSVRQILQYNDVKIELIENYPCESKLELLQQEQYYILQNRKICVNINNAWVDKKEYNRQHRKKNPDMYKKNVQKYYMKNKEKIDAWRADKITCLYCDCKIRRSDKAIHKKSNKHYLAVKFFKEEFKKL